MRLFEFAREFQEFQDLVENHLDFNDVTGEVIDNSEVIGELFKELNIGFSDKLDNTMLYVSLLNGQSETLDKEIKRLQGKKKVIDNKVERLRDIVKSSFIEAGIDKFESSMYKFRIGKSESVEIENIELLGSDYIRVKKEADKVAIKKAIKSGVEVDGACIVVNNSLVVS